MSHDHGGTYFKIIMTCVRLFQNSMSLYSISKFSFSYELLYAWPGYSTIFTFVKLLMGLNIELSQVMICNSIDLPIY